MTKVTKVDPDCTNSGKMEHWSCACGKYFEDALAATEITDITTWGILPAHHTNLTKVNKVDPDCTNSGKMEHWSCSVCHKYYADQTATIEITDIIDTWGILHARHTLTKVNKVDPDCTNNGKEACWSCSDCNKYFEDPEATVEITALNDWGILHARHTLTKVNKVDPDCTNNGKEAYWSCSDCNKYFEDPEATVEITALNDWGIHHARHTFGEWIKEVPATADANGVKAHKDCTICGKHFDLNGNEKTDNELKIDKLTTPPEDNTETDHETGTEAVTEAATVATTEAATGATTAATTTATSKEGCKSVVGSGAAAMIIAAIAAGAALSKRKH